MKKNVCFQTTTAMLAFVASGVAFAPAAVAQEAAVAAAETSAASGTIVVTARRNEESLLETPIAITAFDDEKIQDLGLETIEDVQLFSPGFTFQKFNSIPGRFDQSPRFRGVSIDTLDPTRQTASVFVDGVYIANGASGISLNDIARVEVIKGPQSAYFGRTTFGGAVNYISKKPGAFFAGDYSLSVATRDDYEFTVGLEGPIIGDVLSARVSGAYHFDGGHYENSIVPGQELGEEETYSVTGSLFFEPSDRFDAKVRVSYLKNDDGPAAFATVGRDQHNCGGAIDDRAVTSLFCGEVPVPSGAQIAMNTDVSTVLPAIFTTIAPIGSVADVRDDFGFDRNSLQVSAQFNYELTDNITFSASTGYAHDESSFFSDADYNANNTFYSFNVRDFKVFSQEARLSGEALDGRLNWLVGASYFDLKFVAAGQFVSPASGNLFGDINPNQEDIETIGIFGSLGFEVVDGLTITLEGRYQTDEIVEDDDITDNSVASSAIGDKFKNFLPRIIVDYQVTDNTLLYASFSEGNLPGGFNTQLRLLSPNELAQIVAQEPSVALAYSEETLEAWEAGIKHGFDNGKGYINFAAYTMKRKGEIFRRSLTYVNDAGDNRTFNAFVNAGGTNIKGFELEGSYQFAPSLTANGGVGYNDGTYDTFESSIHREILGTLDASGQSVSRYPQWSANFSLLTEHSISNDLDWYARGDVAYIGNTFTDEANLTESPDGFLVNVRTGVEKENIRFELFVKNVFNTDVPTGVQRNRDLSLGFAGFGVLGYNVGLRDKRQFGMRVTGSF